MVSASQALVLSVFVLLVTTYETQAQNTLLSERCSVDRNCISAQMVCGSGTCTCFRGQLPSDDRRNCIATTTGMCFAESDCRSLQSSSCFIVDGSEGTCTCNEGFAASTDTRRCLPASGFQGACEEPLQCTLRLGNFAVCREGRCGCQEQFQFSPQNQQCIRSIGLGNSCTTSAECSGNSVCERDTCVCPSGFVRVDNLCTAGAQNVIVSGTVFLLYWIIKVVIA